MNWTPWLATVPALLLVLLAVWIRRRRAHASRPSAMLVALLTCGMTLVLIGGEMVDLGRDVTVVDVAALSIAGILTGCFLALALRPTARGGTNA